MVGVSTSQYCDNCVRLRGGGGGLAIGKVDSWGIFDVLVGVYVYKCNCMLKHYNCDGCNTHS